MPGNVDRDDPVIGSEPFGEILPHFERLEIAVQQRKRRFAPAAVADPQGRVVGHDELFHNSDRDIRDAFPVRKAKIIHAGDTVKRKGCAGPGLVGRQGGGNLAEPSLCPVRRSSGGRPVSGQTDPVFAADSAADRKPDVGACGYPSARRAVPLPGRSARETLRTASGGSGCRQGPLAVRRVGAHGPEDAGSTFPARRRSSRVPILACEAPATRHPPRRRPSGCKWSACPFRFS